MKTFSLTRAFAALAILAMGVTIATAQTPIAHWTFDQGVNDYSAITIDDSAQVATTSDAIYADAGGAGLVFGPGQVGGGVYLSGDNTANRTFEIADIPQLDFATGATFTLWFRPDANQVGQAYKGLFMSRDVEDTVGTGRNWGLAWRDVDRIDSRVSGVALATENLEAPADGSWYHVALVWDGDDPNFLNPEQRLYVNGVELDASPLASSVTDILSGGAWSIGRDPGQPSNRNFRGIIDDVAIFGEVLSAGQISTIYNNGLGNGSTSTDAAGNVVADLLIGDVDGDGDVDGIDYATIRGNMNTVAGGRDDGDLTSDGLVDLNDFAQWRAVASPAVLASVGIPEPSSLILMGLAGLFGLGRSRCRS